MSREMIECDEINTCEAQLFVANDQLRVYYLFLTLDLYTRNMEKYNFSSSKMNLDLYSRWTYKSEIYGRCIIKHLDKIAHIGAYLGARYSK